MTTNNHPAHGPVSLDRLHQISEILSKAAAQSDGGNLGYAMADAVKVIDGAIAVFGAEPVLYAAEETLAYAKMGELHLKCLSQPMGDAVIPLYTSPPAPVVPDDLLSMAASAIEDLLEHIDPSTSYYSCVWADVPGKLRTAMLQAGNHTEQHLDMVDHSGDANKMVAGNSPVIGVDLASGPDRTVEVRYVAPPGYVMVPKEPTEAMINAWLSEVANWRGHVAGYKAALAAAPQQENI
ncbi:hypothetical protein [Citrobacter portucalensis]|uniref:hypothetical protein n=1 Tax=Citrobacter portucalensis TaxID=1639133 RepID=UPI00321B67CF